MKIIIDIDEETYKRICKVQDVSELWDMYGEKVISSISSIRNGIPYEERPQGEWIENLDSRNDEMQASCYCSECGASCYCATDKFCHECGADMRGEEE